MFKANCEQHSERPALLSFDEKLNFWSSLSFEEYYRKTLQLGKCLKLLGLDFKDAVSLLAFNHPCWHLLFWGCQMANCVPVGHYQTNSAQTCKDILLDSGSRAIFLDSPEQLRKVRSIAPEVPLLEFLVTFERFPGEDYLSQTELEELATKWGAANPQVLFEAQAAVRRVHRKRLPRLLRD